MAAWTGIEWTDATWTPIRARGSTMVASKRKAGWHCEHASEGCRFCYAEAMNLRLGTGLPFKPGHRRDVELFLDETMLLAPLRWRRPRKVFVCSMTDLFADFVPDEWIDRLFATMALCPQHVFQVLTKRPERMRRYIAGRAGKLARCIVDHHLLKTPADVRLIGRTIDVSWPVRSIGAVDDPDDITMLVWPLPNVWLGTSVEDQANADARIPHLLQTPAAVRFLSCEPLLGAIDLTRLNVPVIDDTWRADAGCDALRRYNPQTFGFNDLARVAGIDWVIVGGESGRNARPMHPDWARSLRDQCAAAGVPFFFKQWGEWAPAPEIIDARGSSFHQFSDGTWMQRVGKKAAGRLLDGVQHDGMPA